MAGTSGWGWVRCGRFGACPHAAAPSPSPHRPLCPLPFLGHPHGRRTVFSRGVGSCKGPLRQRRTPLRRTPVPRWTAQFSMLCPSASAIALHAAREP